MELDGAAMLDSFISADGSAARQNDAAVTAPLHAGDEAAFQRLHEKLAPALRAYIARMSGQPDLADDILQDVFMKYLRMPLPDMGEAATKSYLYRMATNRVTDHWRSQERERKWSWKAIFHKRAGTKLELRGDMARQFGCLAARERALLWLAYVEEFTHEEIAFALNVKPKSVKVLLFRARKKLGALLDPEAELARRLRSLAAEVPANAPLPDPHLLWMKAQLEERAALRERAMRPIAIAQQVALVVFALLGSVMLVAVAEGAQGWLADLGDPDVVAWAVAGVCLFAFGFRHIVKPMSAGD